MAQTVAAIRSEDLIYSRAVLRYFVGKQDLPSDIGVWNNDTTRMPAQMHSEYLRGLLLENRLTAGRFAVEGRVIALNPHPLRFGEDYLLTAVNDQTAGIGHSDYVDRRSGTGERS